MNKDSAAESSPVVSGIEAMESTCLVHGEESELVQDSHGGTSTSIATSTVNRAPNTSTSLERVEETVSSQSSTARMMDETGPSANSQPLSIVDSMNCVSLEREVGEPNHHQNEANSPSASTSITSDVTTNAMMPDQTLESTTSYNADGSKCFTNSTTSRMAALFDATSATTTSALGLSNVTSAVVKPTDRCLFETLPREMIRYIWEPLLKRPKRVDQSTNFEYRESTPTLLIALRAHPQLYQLALSIYYEINRIIFKPDKCAFLRDMSYSTLAMLKNLVIEIPFYDLSSTYNPKNTEDGYYYGCHRDWRDLALDPRCQTSKIAMAVNVEKLWIRSGMLNLTGGPLIFKIINTFLKGTALKSVTVDLCFEDGHEDASRILKTSLVTDKRPSIHIIVLSDEVQTRAWPGDANRRGETQALKIPLDLSLDMHIIDSFREFLINQGEKITEHTFESRDLWREFYTEESSEWCVEALGTSAAKDLLVRSSLNGLLFLKE
ncbi:hypothetical protein BJ875DRAFT_445258 [Amylocarpus encephaloides]|uniref:Uncharacterized protein n=1 Tax=Amylocarpus encephaloides TaxID=45428 RepID=A0A9P7YBU2_9HELO|nr:hypothetical protein BJ875DRAFT_445258 [Amylocarpus encephaloides]